MSEAGEVESMVLEDPEERAYREAFEYYDWNKSGTIPFSVQSISSLSPSSCVSNLSIS